MNVLLVWDVGNTQAHRCCVQEGAMQTHANCYLFVCPPPCVESISGINRQLLGCSLVSPPFVKSISFRKRLLGSADFLRKCFLRLVSLWAKAKRLTLANA